MIDFNISEIVPLCAEFGVELTEDKIKKLNAYGNLLLEWNEKMNLTAIKEPKEVLYKHFYDCILFFKNVEIPQNATLIDIGTGAGFPGLVLKIVRPDIEVTLLDSLNKRLVFLNEVIAALGLKGIKTVHSRAEDGGKNKLYREKFQIATARAVASMPVLYLPYSSASSVNIYATRPERVVGTAVMMEPKIAHGTLSQPRK